MTKIALNIMSSYQWEKSMIESVTNGKPALTRHIMTALTISSHSGSYVVWFGG